MTQPDTNPEAKLAHELAALRHEIARLNTHRFVRQMNSPGRTVAHQFIRGLAFGLGTALGATFLVSMVAFLLGQFDFVPILGEWAAQIAREIQLQQ